MVFQKRHSAKDFPESKDGKSKPPEKGNKRSASKSDSIKPNKQPKEEKKNIEESSVSSEDLSNDMASANRSSDDSESGSAADLPGSGDSSTTSTPENMTSSMPNKKSNLTKIPFAPGLRLEAKDLGNEVWYAAKVVEVDWEEEEILIHFEKWSQRYDEWISMDSSRLRPIQEATVPSSKTTKKSSKVFKIGDRVNATWSDSRKYPATVKSILPGDRYEVLFMDGYTKVIKGSRMAKLKESDMLNAEQFDPEKLGVFKVPEKPPAPPVLSPLVTDTEVIGTKAERRERKRKLNVAELFHVKKRPRKSPPSPSSSKLPENETEKEMADEKKEPLKSKQDVRDEVLAQEDQHQSNRGSRQRRVSDEDVAADVEEAMQGCDVDAGEKSVVAETGAEPEKLAAEEIKKEEGEVKARRKIIPKVRGQDEEEVKPRKRLKRERGEGGGRMRRGVMSNRMSRKLARKGLQDGKEQAYSAESTEPEPIPGTSQEPAPPIVDTPKAKKQDGDVEKPSRKSALDGWEPEGEPAYIVESAEGLRKSIIVPDHRLPEGWIKHMIQRKGGHSAGKWDVFFVCPQGRKFRSRHELRNYFEEKGEEFPRDQFDFSLGRRKMRWTARDPSSSKTSPPILPRSAVGRGGKLPGPSPPDDQPIRRVKTLLPKVRVPQTEDGGSSAGPENGPPRSPLPPYTTTVASIPAGRIPDDASDGGVLVGSLKIQMENDAFMCPKEGCNKHFRKENLLQMHIKHYHPEYNKFMGSTPNVADLAYARTIGEPVEDLIPKARYSVASPTFLEKINRFEATRKAKSLGSSGLAGMSPTSGSAASAPDLIPVERKKSIAKDLKPGMMLSGKKNLKSELDNSSSESSLAAEDSISVTGRQDENPPVLEPAMSTSREERKEQQSTIKTLLPVVRTSTPAQDLTLAERLKMRYPSEDTLGDAVLRKEQLMSPQSPQQSQTQPPILQQQTPLSSQSSMPSLTKSMRTVRRKHMSDFHMEPLMKKRKSAKAPELLPEDADLNEDVSLHSDSSSFRYSRKKMPVVHLEKLQTTTDSNASLEGEDRSKSPLLDSPAKTRVEQLRREEIINCVCGYNEEDGLMIQCDLCLCWQHGLCSKIEKETDVPDKYVCPICLNPPRERRSRHYMHDQDWLKEGLLPSFSFRSKNLENIKQREVVVKRTHELTATLHQLNQVIYSLRVKLNIAQSPDQHPKLYLWAKSWEEDDASTSQSSPQGYKREAKVTSDPVLQEMSQLDPLPLLHAFGKEVKTDSATPTQQEMSEENPHTEHGTGTGKQTIKDSKVEENWSGSFAPRNLSYPMPPSAMEEDMCSVSSAEPFQLNLSEDEHTSPEPASLDPSPSEERSASSNLANQNASEDEEPTAESPPKEGFEATVEDPDTKDTEMSGESTGNSEPGPKKDGDNDPEENRTPDEEEKVETEEKVSEDKVSEEKVVEENVPAEEEEKMDVDVKPEEPVEEAVEPAQEVALPVEEVVEALEETVVPPPEMLDPSDSIIETVEELVESREEVVESTDDNQMVPLEGTGDSQEANAPEIEDGMESGNPASPSRIEGHILHQALTNGIPPINSEETVDSHNMLQLPICQSELMQLASSIANNLEETEPEKQRLQEPVPEALIDPDECRTRLLDHIENYQQQIEARLTTIETQLTALESVDPYSASDEPAEFYPRNKQALQMLLRDLLTIQRLSALN